MLIIGETPLCGKTVWSSRSGIPTSQDSVGKPEKCLDKKSWHPNLAGASLHYKLEWMPPKRPPKLEYICLMKEI